MIRQQETEQALFGLAYDYVGVFVLHGLFGEVFFECGPECFVHRVMDLLFDAVRVEFGLFQLEVLVDGDLVGKCHVLHGVGRHHELIDGSEARW